MKPVSGWKVVDSGLKAPAGFIWDISKAYVHPRLQEFSYDFAPLRETMIGFLRTAASLELQGLQILQPRVEPSNVVVPIAFEVPDAWLTPPPLRLAGQRAPALPALPDNWRTRSRPTR